MRLLCVLAIGKEMENAGNLLDYCLGVGCGPTPDAGKGSREMYHARRCNYATSVLSLMSGRV